ncbi:uncharacterized protein LOC127244375 [Andrographis paniculata]|uniref:uncharacterized protein LOC127244375 n=1 Tax=Andrographis paniculata TaxID=175694 RepID=UPI0021E70A5C|nr:uncharacterized protein LOC127244375 [Andrographis paniculata]
MAGDNKSEEQLKAVWFAAGVAAFMACIERAVMVPVFMHWRVWVFLVLNLLLLAILFTSKPKHQHQHQSMAIDQEDDTREFAGEKKSLECSPQVLTTVQECSGDDVMHETKNAKDEVKKEDEELLLSKEELNHRVEAFIAMFRQHLVTDAKL